MISALGTSPPRARSGVGPPICRPEPKCTRTLLSLPDAHARGEVSVLAACVPMLPGYVFVLPAM